MSEAVDNAAGRYGCHDLGAVMRSVILVSSLSILCCTSAYADPHPVSLPQTGQTSCYKAMGTAVIACAGTGQDGNTLAGVPWPSPRFINNSDETMTDQLTGLVWPRDANPGSVFKTWQQALDYIKTLNGQKYLGHADWRLPNIKELESLGTMQPKLADWLHAQGFRNVVVDYYWSSSTYAALPNNAWSFGMYGGIVAGRGKADSGYLWPVRSGQPGTCPLPKTGQTACYDTSGTAIACAGTGQDGELQAGVAWTRPRFTDNADRTMTDRMTGLVWIKDSMAPGPASCGSGKPKNWQDALDYVACLNRNNFLGKSDWRLPNRNELASLVSHGQPNSAVWLNMEGFANVQAFNYWSSTTYVYATWNAWNINMHDGAVTSNAKKRDINVWPVRGGY